MLFKVQYSTPTYSSMKDVEEMLVIARDDADARNLCRKMLGIMFSVSFSKDCNILSARKF